MIAGRRRIAGCRNALWAICAGLLATAAQADIPPETGHGLVAPRVITNPDWIRKPTGYEFSEFYPPGAMGLKLNGFASVDCAVVVDGTLADCRVVTEDPYGLGFGDAALKMTAFFAMQPKLVDGSPVGGARVIIPIRFAIPSTSTPSIPEPPPPSPAALALARRVMLAQHADAAMHRYVDQYVETFAGSLERSSGGVLSADVEATIKAAKDASYAEIPAYLEREAIIIGSSLTVAELEAITTFLESPAGRAWTAAGLANQAAFGRVGESFGQSIFKRLCNATRCAPHPPKP